MSRFEGTAENDKDPLFVTALARGMEVLRCFTAGTPELSASQIARMTKLPQPTVWRLCHTLIELGYLDALPGRQTMKPGIGLLGLGQAVLSGQPVAELALPHMQAIADRHEGAVSLGARDGLSMIYLQRCQGPSIIRVDLRVGSRVPLATSATGWAYIAGLGEPERQATIDALRAEGRDNWDQVEADLQEALRHHQETGYIINRGWLHPQINSVAAPIRSADGNCVLSLSSGGISHIFSSQKLEQIGRELTKLAAKLAPLLTWQKT
jgi:DNA-binding IclR family transcriptional regulator